MEAVLLRHPLVLDAAVVGKKDEKLGEAPKAYVVLRPQAQVSAQELHHFVEGRLQDVSTLQHRLKPLFQTWGEGVAASFTSYQHH